MSEKTISYNFNVPIVDAKKDKIFHLSDFRPIGILVPKYPETYCVFCRDYLTEPCSKCVENNNFDCDVSTCDGKYYHYHCQKEFTKK
ncbi:hypothetical protein ma629 [Moumouvirus australiensis]|uniref:Uncharacterized protein n=1 Tax=Moumouvirus australiensis TaxID=2109587 RepID=A0A2P1EM93_9VIRU|nr:hypothetical protein QKC55_gp276 [Moumouvirus australiensis]AVL95015.1 hypothetical protein ma629 [Moumouvirus australiensis]